MEDIIEYTTGKGVIYKLTSPSGKVYIGQSINFKNRLNKYKNTTTKSIGNYLFNAIQKYGFDNFNVEILAVIELDDDITVTKMELDRLEIYYIQKLDSFNNGYNLTAGGGGSFKRIISEETRMKISTSNKGKNSIDGVLLHCPICNIEFYLKPYQIKSRLRTNKSIDTISCSRKCGYAKLKNNNKLEVTGSNPVPAIDN